MKRSTKKYLMLFMALVVLMTVSVLTASAATEVYCSNCQKFYQVYASDVIEPTCTQEGYTEIKCNVCNTVIGKADIVPAKGHEFKNSAYVSYDGGYSKQFTCACNYTITEKDDNDETVKYYKVSFYNPMVAQAYDGNIRYTNVVTERKVNNYEASLGDLSDSVLLAEIFVKEGTEAIYPYVLDPVCEKDVNYGRYDFIGWFDGYEMQSAEAVASTSNKISLKAVNSNMTVYAGFKGVNMAYTVRFYDYNGRALATGKNVYHGKGVTYTLGTPTRTSDVKYRYEFHYWEYDGSAIDLTQIYGDVSLKAKYEAIEREYNFTYYYDAECTQPIYNKEIQVRDDNIRYGEAATNGLAIDPQVLVKDPAGDKQYIYEWTGKWVLANRQNWVVSLEAVSVPDGTPDTTDGSSEVRLIPQYVKKSKVYDLNVTVIYPEDGNYHPEDVTIQVVDANGSLVGADKAVKVPGTESTYEYTFLVNYSAQYTVSASATGYLGQEVSNFRFDTPSNVIITMEKVEAFSCGCICHTFLKPIWVRILRLLHTLFGTEHVCCSDMYANIGNQLNYGPGVK